MMTALATQISSFPQLALAPTEEQRPSRLLAEAKLVRPDEQHLYGVPSGAKPIRRELPPAEESAAVSAPPASEKEAPSSAVSTADRNVELIERMRRDPVGAAPLVYAQLAPYVNRLTWSLLGSDPERSDVVQQVFCCVLKDCTKLRDPQRFHAWVRAITINTVYQLLRERHGHANLLAERDKELRGDLARDVEARDLLLRMKTALDKLRPQERQAFVLRFVERRTLAEIARIEGYSVPTARRRLTRAKRRLKVMLARTPDLVVALQKKPPSQARRARPAAAPSELAPQL